MNTEYALYRHYLFYSIYTTENLYNRDGIGKTQTMKFTENNPTSSTKSCKEKVTYNIYSIVMCGSYLDTDSNQKAVKFL